MHIRAHCTNVEQLLQFLLTIPEETRPLMPIVAYDTDSQHEIAIHKVNATRTVIGDTELCQLTLL